MPNHSVINKQSLLQAYQNWLKLLSKHPRWLYWLLTSNASLQLWINDKLSLSNITCLAPLIESYQQQQDAPKVQQLMKVLLNQMHTCDTQAIMTLWENPLFEELLQQQVLLERLGDAWMQDCVERVLIMRDLWLAPMHHADEIEEWKNKLSPMKKHQFISLNDDLHDILRYNHEFYEKLITALLHKRPQSRMSAVRQLLNDAPDKFFFLLMDHRSLCLFFVHQWQDFLASKSCLAVSASIRRHTRAPEAWRKQTKGPNAYKTPHRDVATLSPNDEISAPKENYTNQGGRSKITSSEGYFVPEVAFLKEPLQDLSNNLNSRAGFENKTDSAGYFVSEMRR